MSDQWDEKAEKLLPCGWPILNCLNIGVDDETAKKHHRDCPAIWRSEVASAFREMDEQHKGKFLELHTRYTQALERASGDVIELRAELARLKSSDPPRRSAP